jgi:DNA excision repair protein ERCC-8
LTQGGADERLLVWDSNTLQIAEEFSIQKSIFCLRMSPPPSTVVAVASTSNHVRLVDLKSGSSTHELRGHAGMAFIKLFILYLFVNRKNSVLV